LENEEINPVALTEKNLTEANSTIAQRSLQEKGNDHGSPAIASGSSNLATVSTASGDHGRHAGVRRNFFKNASGDHDRHPGVERHFFNNASGDHG